MNTLRMTIIEILFELTFGTLGKMLQVADKRGLIR
jgi:hypothetical protein